MIALRTSWLRLPREVRWLLTHSADGLAVGLGLAATALLAWPGLAPGMVALAYVEAGMISAVAGAAIGLARLTD